MYLVRDTFHSRTKKNEHGFSVHISEEKVVSGLGIDLGANE